jgi:hypothetical protein
VRKASNGAYGRGKQWQQALGLLTDGQWQLALGILAVMQKAGLVPDLITEFGQLQVAL